MEEWLALVQDSLLPWGPFLGLPHLSSSKSTWPNFHTRTGWQEAEAGGEAAWPRSLESHPHDLLPSLQSTGRDRRCLHKVISGSRAGVEASVDIHDSGLQHVRGGLGGEGRKGPDSRQHAMHIMPCIPCHTNRPCTSSHINMPCTSSHTNMSCTSCHTNMPYHIIPHQHAMHIILHQHAMHIISHQHVIPHHPTLTCHAHHAMPTCLAHHPVTSLQSQGSHA